MQCRLIRVRRVSTIDDSAKAGVSVALSTVTVSDPVPIGGRVSVLVEKVTPGSGEPSAME
jgi:acyl dehydratase